MTVYARSWAEKLNENSMLIKNKKFFSAFWFQFKRFFFLNFFVSKLKQFLRTCSPIVKTYCETFLVFGKIFFEDFSRFRITIHIHTSLLLRMPQKYLSHTSAHISLLRVLGNRDFTWKTDSLVDDLDRIWMQFCC